jgi:hypothetical protein
MRVRHDRKKLKQREADERATAYGRLTPGQKLTKLDDKLGKGVGAKKQRDKLSSS